MKRFFQISSVLVLFVATQISCKNDSNSGLADFLKPAVIDISTLENSLNLDSAFSIQEIVDNDSTFYDGEITRMYSQPKSYWFDKFGLNENGKKLLTQFEIAETEGLISEDYFAGELDSLLGDIENAEPSQLKEAELKMSYGFLKYSKDLLLGRLTSIKIDKNWQNINDTTWSADSLISWIQTKPVDEVFNNLRPAHPWYNKFWDTAKKITKLNSYQMLATDLPKTLAVNDSSIEVQNLRKLLAEVADTSLDKISMVWDANAEQALRTYQQDFALEETGIIDSATLASLTQESDENLKQLGMNMERMRWLIKDFDKEYIWVNIPEMGVKYFEDDSVTFEMRAVVGKVSRKTPTLDSRLSDIVFNPPWYVPPTILRQEIIPGIARRGGSYLRRRGLVARDRRGRIVNPSRINSSNYRRYSISQNPGRNSALGSVKFNFPNKEAIFLHDTNHRSGFTRKYRASSSGCIRVHHPKDFARFILRDSTFSVAGIDSIIKNRTTKSIDVPRNIGVHLVYLTNAVDSAGRVIKVNDIYKWDKKLAASL